MTELERLREIVRYMSEPDMEMATELAELRAMQQRAREAERGEGDLEYLSAHEIVRYILGEA